MILLLGDQPSKKNFKKEVPFVGTVSYRNLLNWVYKLDISVTEVILANSSDCKVRMVGDVIEIQSSEISSEVEKIIALGNQAEKFLKRNGIRNYFKMPHPSPKNRVLNDKKLIQELLDKCYNYVHD